MAELFGQRWSRAELERRIGHVSQLGGVRLLTSDNGPSRGVRLIEFRTGTGFIFEIALDRGMDVGRAEYRGERVIVHRGNKAVAAVVPIEDVELLEKLEDEIDITAAREALKDPRTIPWETVKKKLRL